MLWGGRFSGAPDADMLRLTSSLDVDLRLLPYDCRVTKAHARTLVAAGLLEERDLTEVDRVCDELVDEWERGVLPLGAHDEDVHSLVERELSHRLGDVGRRIHAGRSRNDLVATDFRLWCRDAARSLARTTADLCRVIVRRAEEHAETVMPGFTHLQPAQPVSAGFHFLAHGFAMLRDIRRFEHAAEAADVSPLGAGALAGTTLPLDVRVAQDELGFAGLFDNAMDAVSDRDFAADLLYACALCAVHLSRIGEEIVLWTSPTFGFARLSDEWSTGSSMMPQKRNPDLAELVRGRTGPAIGDLTGLLSLLKGLPLAYGRDLQEDKDIVFRAVERTEGSISGVARMLDGLVLDTDGLRAAAGRGAMWATDLAEVLVERGVPFRDAHEVVGRVVASVESEGSRLTDEVLVGAHDAFRPGDSALADPVRAVAARTTSGGPSPARVREQIQRLRAALGVVPES